MERKKTTIYLTEEDERKLDFLTGNGERSRASVIREAIAHFYAETPFVMPTGNLFEDDELSSNEIDEWIATHRTID